MNSKERSSEECDFATLVGLCLARRVLMVIPDGGVTATASRFSLEKAMQETGDHHAQSQAYRIASRITLPSLDDQPGTSSPLDAWSNAIWEAIDEANEKATA